MTSQPTTPELRAAAESLIEAYRARYTTPSTGRIRNDAPLRTEMGRLKLALQQERADA